jgi:hypothetical protein
MVTVIPSTVEFFELNLIVVVLFMLASTVLGGENPATVPAGQLLGLL